MIPHLAKLQQFRETLYTLFPKRKDAIMNLLDALTSQGHQCDSIVQLSNATCFERQYSSITDAIADGLPEAQWEAIRKLVYQQMETHQETQPHRFILDCTPNPRPYARKLADRHITHAPNPAPGNKPICVGHQYSVLTLSPVDSAAQEKHWVLPVSAKRVASAQKGNEVGMKQLITSIEELGLTQEMSISVGDTLYGTENCRMSAAQQENLVHICRLSTRRNVFCAPPAQHGNGVSKGRKKEFGAKMKLGEPSTHPACHQEVTTHQCNRKGTPYTVTIKCWKDMLLRGSRQFRASQHPFNLVQVSVTNEKGEPVFKRPLWLAVLGKRRHDVGLIDAHQHYASRYDIEHFFRFGKRHLLMAAYQTADVTHEALWWQLGMLAYTQLYLSKELVACLPAPWERYLPEYKHINSEDPPMRTPSQTQRGFADLLNTIGTPANACVARGKPRGRMAGDIQVKRETLPIMFKTKKSSEQTTERILLGSEPAGHSPDPQKIDDLITLVQSSLEKFNVTPSEFTKMLIDSS